MPTSNSRVPSTDELVAMRRVLAQRGMRPNIADAHILRQLDSGSFGTYSAKFELPWDANVEAIQQQSRSGALTVIVPKRPDVAPRSARPQTARARHRPQTSFHGRPHSARAARPDFS